MPASAAAGGTIRSLCVTRAVCNEAFDVSLIRYSALASTPSHVRKAVLPDSRRVIVSLTTSLEARFYASVTLRTDSRTTVRSPESARWASKRTFDSVSSTSSMPWTVA